MTTEDSWLETTRAEDLAKLELTQHEDLEILQSFRSSLRAGYDFLVRIHDRGVTPPPELGVAIRGTRDPLSPATLRRLAADADRAVRGDGLPVCLIVFQVETREGRYRWLREPVVGSGPENGITASWERISGATATAEFADLDTEAIEQIVERVVRWDRARVGVLAG